MSVADEPAPSSQAERYVSLASLRVQHAELLREDRRAGDAEELLARVEAFLVEGAAAGALIEADADRWAAQALLDYWTTRLYRAGREPTHATLTEFDPSLAPELPESACPYRGLDAFREDDHQLFFGRARVIEDWLARVRGGRFLAVVGSSGSGKLSLVLGGLIPSLRSGALPNSAAWRYLPPIVPGSDPLGALAELFRPDGAQAGWVDEQTAIVRGEPAHLVALLGDGPPAALVVDQFEEVFTLCLDPAARRAFAECLLALATAPETEHRVVLTLRTDFEDRLALLPERFQQAFGTARVAVPPLTAAELRDAIEKPAELVGLKFEEGIADRLIGEILGERAGLPLLQFTLLKLWEQRARDRVTWEAYRRLSGPREALGRVADALYDQMSPQRQITTRRVLLRLVRPDEGLEFTSSRLRRADLHAGAEARDRVDDVLERLVGARLLRRTPGDEPAEDRFEVAHEALVRNWRRLADWLDEERVTLRRRLRLTAAAEHWQASDRDPGGLWSGALLDEALGYDDRGPLEEEFVAASRGGRGGRAGGAGGAAARAGSSPQTRAAREGAGRGGPGAGRLGAGGAGPRSAAPADASGATGGGDPVRPRSRMAGVGCPDARAARPLRRASLDRPGPARDRPRAERASGDPRDGDHAERRGRAGAAALVGRAAAAGGPARARRPGLVGHLQPGRGVGRHGRQ